MSLSNRDSHRVIKSARNIFTSAFFQIILGFVAFAERTVFIHYLSTDYLGLNSLFANILSVLSIAELGIGSAIAFALYKPLAENDNRKIYLYMKFFQKAYQTIGIAIIILGLIISPFVRNFATNADSINNISLYFIIYLFGVGLTYFFSYRQIIIDADQNKYISQAIISGGSILQQLIQIVILIFTRNYVLYLFTFFFFNISKNILISIIASKKYKVLNSKEFKKDRLEAGEKRRISLNVKAMCFHKFGEVAIGSSDSILISYIVDIATLGIYANYQLILEALRSSMRIFTNSVQASIGNICATETNDKIFSSFKTLNFTNFILYSYLSVLIYILTQPIITIWLGSKYLLQNSTVFLIAISIFLNGSRAMIISFHDAFGLFWNDRYKRIIEAGVNILSSFILGRLYGINGIFIGTIISNLIGFGIEGYVVYKNAFEKPVSQYIRMYLNQLLVTIFVMAVTNIIASLYSGGKISTLIFKIVICIAVPILIYFILYRKNNDFISMKKSIYEMLNLFLSKKRKNTTPNSLQ